MKRLITKGIILSRTDYGEADRIITVLTPDHGKLRLMAKGVRRPKSKLAGGIELFSISDVTYISGRGEIGTLVSSRLKKHYGFIAHDITHVQLGYEIIKLINRATEDQPEPAYFALLEAALTALDNLEISPELTRVWFEAQLLKQAGHMPNLTSDMFREELQAGKRYSFNFDQMCFEKQSGAKFGTDHIKTLRILFSRNSPATIQKVQGVEGLMASLSALIHAMLTSYIQV